MGDDRRYGGLGSGPVFTSQELVSAGVPAARIRRLVGQGRLVVVRRGVYAPAELAAACAGDKGRAHGLEVAAVLARCGFPGAGSHRSAALIHGLDLIGQQQAGLVTVTRSPRDHGSRSLRALVSVHAAELPADHLTVCRGVRLTSVARTVVDLARSSSFRDGVVAADSALRARKTTVAEIGAVLSCCSGWPGIRRAREVAGFCDGRSESALESVGRVVFHEYELPPPDLQVMVGCEDIGVIGRADYLWSEHGTIAEADGALKYADRGRAVGQLHRDTRLRDAGFEVVHFTWQEITMTPWQVVARIRAAFARGQRATARAS